MFKSSTISHDGRFPKVRIPLTVLNDAEKGVKYGRFFHHIAIKRVLKLLNIQCSMYSDDSGKIYPLSYHHVGKGWYTITW